MNDTHKQQWKLAWRRVRTRNKLRRELQGNLSRYHNLMDGLSVRPYMTSAEWAAHCKLTVMGEWALDRRKKHEFHQRQMDVLVSMLKVAVDSRDQRHLPQVLIVDLIRELIDERANHQSSI